jgi:DNA mismatch repair protein MutL
MIIEERKIQVLPPAEARRIAAGEVIDRPAALVREFLDNAIDAGGRLIEVLIDEGGINRIEVVDDGDGMGKEDLELCYLAHATSKIRCLDDLKTAVTLGFRGEALAAAAAVSRLEILSSRDGREAWKLCVGPGEKNPPNLELGRRAKGTSVRAIGLYDTIPARKRFLKRAGSEGTACRQIFNEKALAFPGVAFRYSQDESLKCFLPPASSLIDRFSQIFLEERESVFLHEISAIGNGFSVSVVAGGPELSRNDRRFQFVYANNRRIQDFSILQALEYGLQGWFPNGAHPIGAVFITIDPALADCNIHPAKREVRFADPGAIHHALSSALRDFCRHANMVEKVPTILAPEVPIEPKVGTFFADTFYAAEDTVPYSATYPTPEITPVPEPELKLEKNRTRYLGRIFDLFILVEKNDTLFVIDQHAAHERILYDKFLSGNIPKQELLVAIPFVTENQEEDSFLKQKQGELAKLGITIKQNGDEWLIEALPAGWKLSDRETVEEILNLKNAKENIGERWAATYSCRSAAKDGDFLDERTALALAEEALALPVSRCPHGRPIWLELTRDNLFKAVKRS